MVTVGAFYGGLSTICCYEIFLFEICVLVFRAFVLPVLDLITYFIKLGDPLEVYKLNETILWIKIAIYCPQGSGTLRQQLLMMH